LCWAWRLEDDERDHICRLAGASARRPGTTDLHVRASILRLLDRFTNLPAILLSAKGDVLARNQMSSALHRDELALN